MQENIANRLQSFAQAAVCHAADQHGLVLDHRRLDIVDRILDIERSKEHSEHRHALTLCYGAWLGEWAVSNVGGRWVGLAELTPPRIVVNGVPTSPMDAVECRLQNDRSPTIQALVEQWIAWSNQVHLDAQTRSQNRLAWDARQNDKRFVRTEALPADRDEAIAAIDPWLLESGTIEGRRVLCLAAGGGTHGPLLAIAGADVTVVDFSDRQLDIDRQLASRHRLSIRTVEASIDDLSSLASSSFDMVVQPVSTCYVRDISRVYTEVARILRPNGLYVSQHKQPTSLQAEVRSIGNSYAIRNFADEGHALQPTTEVSVVRENEMTEFVHTWDALIGSLCRSGFVIEDLQEPPRGDAWAAIGSPEHRARFLPPYVKIKARRY